MDYSYVPPEKVELFKVHPKKKYVVCPFCYEADFDLIGLKGHYINGYCDRFNEIETILRKL